MPCIPNRMCGIYVRVNLYPNVYVSIQHYMERSDMRTNEARRADYVAKHQQRITECYGSIIGSFHYLEKFKSNYEYLLKRLDTCLWSESKYKRLPLWAKHQVQGYLDGMRTQWESDRLEKRFYWRGHLTTFEHVETGTWNEAQYAGMYYKGTDIKYF